MVEEPPCATRRPRFLTLPRRSGSSAAARQQLTTAILEGKGTVMPAFRGKLNEAQIRDLVTYLRAFAPQPASASVGPETDFKRRFDQLTQELDDLKKQYQDLSKK